MAIKNLTSIDRLWEEVYWCCVNPLYPKDETTAKLWKEDEFLRLKHGYYITPLPEKLKGHILDAISFWKRREIEVFEKMGMKRDEFLRKFRELREDYYQGGKRWKKNVVIFYSKVKGAVKNIQWVDLFSWILPIADSENVEVYRSIGMVMTALFYIEMLFKSSYPSGEDYIKRIEARWKIVNMDFSR